MKREEILLWVYAKKDQLDRGALLQESGLVARIVRVVKTWPRQPFILLAHVEQGDHHIQRSGRLVGSENTGVEGSVRPVVKVMIRMQELPTRYGKHLRFDVFSFKHVGILSKCVSGKRTRDQHD